jgi:hypothetical protein
MGGGGFSMDPDSGGVTPARRAYQLQRSGDGVTERALTARYLGE